MAEPEDRPALTVRYVLRVLFLYLTRKISRRTLWVALKERPAAVAGRGGAYGISAEFD